jgi:hypothetical protein
MPCVVSAVKSGATSLISGMYEPLFAFAEFMFALLKFRILLLKEIDAAGAPAHQQ